MTMHALPSPTHPAQVPEGTARIAAIEKWCAAGWDPHLGPEGTRLDRHQVPTAADQSVWALALCEGSGMASGAAGALQSALKAGAELQHPVAVAGGWITPLMAVLSGPLEEALLKLRMLKKAAPLTLDGHWPAGDDRHGLRPIHLLVVAQPGTTPDLRPAAVEQMIIEMFEDVMGAGPAMATTALVRDRQGALALHHALRLGRYDVALRLLQVAPAEQALAKDHQGNGAFHALAKGGWNTATSGALLRVAKELGTHGATWTTANQEGVSALDLALAQAKTPEETQAWRNLSQRSTPALI